VPLAEETQWEVATDLTSRSLLANWMKEEMLPGIVTDALSEVRGDEAEWQRREDRAAISGEHCPASHDHNFTCHTH
jgi:hypothetical protein